MIHQVGSPWSDEVMYEWRHPDTVIIQTRDLAYLMAWIRDRFNMRPCLNSAIIYQKVGP